MRTAITVLLLAAVAWGQWGQNTQVATLIVRGDDVGAGDPYAVVACPYEVRLLALYQPCTVYLMASAALPMPAPSACVQPVWNIGCDAFAVLAVAMNGPAFVDVPLDAAGLPPFAFSLQLLVVPDPAAGLSNYAYSSQAARVLPG